VKKNAIVGRRFESWPALEGRLGGWMREIADQRVHGTTAEAPIDRFRRAEAGASRSITGVPPFAMARELVRKVQAAIHALASTGIYAYVRHPQYVGFILVMFGFLLQWPTLLTLAMFPVLSSCMCASRAPRSARRWPNSEMPIKPTWPRCPVFSRASDHRAAGPAREVALRADHRL
jgi:hypothetical protein